MSYDFKRKIAEELHRAVRVRYPTRKTELKGRYDLYQADLVDMQPYARVNRGHKYILTMINCFSKIGIAVPLKTKTGKEVALALTPILSKHRMRHLHTDQGREFFNPQVKQLLDTYKINHYFTFSQHKAAIVERFNRTLKNWMWREFTAQGTYKWLDLLPKLIKRYNNTFHRTIGMKPVQVTGKTEEIVLQKLRNIKKSLIKKPKFQVGQKVRISRHRRTFAKSYLPNYTNEVFEIVKVQPTIPVTYLLRDYQGNQVLGGFYEQELLQTKFDNVYLVEKVLKREGNRVLVRWQGYDKSHDSWIDKKDLV